MFRVGDFVSGCPECNAVTTNKLRKVCLYCKAPLHKIDNKNSIKYLTNEEVTNLL